MLRWPTMMLLCVAVIGVRPLAAEPLWQLQSEGIGDINIRSLAFFQANDQLLCAAATKRAYFSDNGGEYWREIFSLGAQEAEINFIAFAARNPQKIFIATTKGLFATNNQGLAWENVFTRSSATAQNVYCLAADPLDAKRVYIGTGAGLYYSDDAAATWSKGNGGLPNSPVRSICIHPNTAQTIYLANAYGLFKSIDRANSWQRLFLTSHRLYDEENSAQEEQGEENPDESGDSQNLITCIAIDQRKTKNIYLATTQGVFFSGDAGGSWNKLPSQGLVSPKVNFIVISAHETAKIYAATELGVFEFQPKAKRWRELYQGMASRTVSSLALSGDEEHLAAGADKGVFIAKSAPKKPKDIAVHNETKKRPAHDVVLPVSAEVLSDANCEQILRQLSNNEPTISEIQQAALRYAEVIHPDQIKALRRDARLKALFPDVSLDYEKTVQAGGTGANFGSFAVGPRDWNFSLSWDVGDIIFNEQLRLVDSNTRLMVQLRDDILTEVTRLYYERRKTQAELALSPPQTPQAKLDIILRLEELTASIDALSGGYLSRNLKQKCESF
ncbi:MAG: hypothetical protein V1727_01745 [Candidatus Omnitrophota bacterium]